MERLTALSRSTSIPANFIFLGIVQVPDTRAAEAQLHAIFADARTQRGEFFKISVPSALEALRHLGAVQVLRVATNAIPHDLPTFFPILWSFLIGIFVCSTAADIVKIGEPYSFILSTQSSVLLGFSLGVAAIGYNFAPAMRPTLLAFAQPN